MMVGGSRATVLVVDDSMLIRMLAKEELEKANFQVSLAGSGEEALAMIRRNRPDVLVTDVVMPGLTGYELCRRVRQDPSTHTMPILLLTGQGGVAEKVRGFEAGADDYMVKPFESAELVARVGALLARVRRGEPAPPRVGKTIACFSLKGGAGTTSLAANLAVALARLWGEATALVDMSLEKGCASLFLNLSPKVTIEDLCQQIRNGVILEETELEVYFTVHSSGVNLLAAPSAPEKAELIDSRAVPTILEALKERFPYIVLDTASTFDERTLAVLDGADVILLLATPDLASLKVTRDALNAFRALEGPYGKTKLVLNQIFEHGALGRREVEGALRFPLAAQVPNGGERMLQALNNGNPIVLSGPELPTAEAIYDLAYLVSDREASLARVQTPNPLLVKVRKRFGGGE